LPLLAAEPQRSGPGPHPQAAETLSALGQQAWALVDPQLSQVKRLEAKSATAFEAVASGSGLARQRLRESRRGKVGDALRKVAPAPGRGQRQRQQQQQQQQQQQRQRQQRQRQQRRRRRACSRRRCTLWRLRL
jgi:hypothetical protein